MSRDRLPSLDALLTFDVAARELSFTRAAQRLFVTQSAVSKQIRALEEDLAVALFERRQRALALTPAGRTLQGATEESFARLQAVVRRIREGDETTVTLTTTPSLASLWLIPRLSAFLRSNPGIDVRISADVRVVDLDRGGHDIAIRYLADRDAPRGAPRLFGETVLPVCSPALLADPARPLAEPGDLRFHTLLAYEDDLRDRPWLGWPLLLEALGVGGLRPAGTVSFNQYDQLLHAAIDGQGIAVGSLGLVQQPLSEGRLVAPFPHRQSADRGYYVLPAPEARRKPSVRQFCDWLCAQAESGGTRIDRTEGSNPPAPRPTAGPSA